MLRTRVTIFFLLLSAFYVARAQKISDEAKTNIKERVENGEYPGIAIALIDKNGVEYYNLGVRSLKGKEPVNEHSVFEIGSITKTFTGTLLADAVLKGKMKLEDSLQKYLPAGIKAPRRNGEFITLVHLANHTSSLPRMPDNFRPANPKNPFADYTEQQLYDFLNNYQLTRDIGSQYEYSNYAQGLLGHTLAKASALSYEELMVSVVAKPLNMQDTRVTMNENMNLAVGHAGETAVENWDFIAFAGAGAIRSTAADMVKYLQANMGLTKTKLYPALELAQKHSRVEGNVPMVGLGWHSQVIDDQEIIWHNGGTGGYRTFVGFVKGLSKGVVVLANSTVSVDDIGRHLLVSASPLKATQKTITVDDNVLEGYVGKYELTPGFVLTVSRTGNQLKVQATGQPELPVYAKAVNVFYYKAVEAQLTFNVSGEDKLKTVTLEQGGQKMVAKRIEN
jgi:serine-type D-Ala-D-Ala carboxypeptidase/endopeptidase